ncbi:MAG: DUF2391 family protein [Candidatus Latescibacterota bacterium]|nr:MAG: DUF2391 family protein [Candidatus Latescibacterota bacterium]
MTEKSEVTSQEVSIQRMGRNGYLHRVIPIVDKSGKIVQRVVKPLMVEFRVRDVLQVVVGASILAIPAAYTEEAWNLGRDLPIRNILGIACVSIVFIATFVYFNFYKSYLGRYLGQYLTRVVSTYLIAAIVVAALLTLVGQCPWGVDNVLAIKRIIVVAFPASMSATVTDALK